MSLWLSEMSVPRSQMCIFLPCYVADRFGIKVNIGRGGLLWSHMHQPLDQSPARGRPIGPGTPQGLIHPQGVRPPCITWQSTPLFSVFFSRFEAFCVLPFFFLFFSRMTSPPKLQKCSSSILVFECRFHSYWYHPNWLNTPCVDFPLRP